VIQLEHENTGIDYCLNIKAINPSPIDGSGVYIGSYLQSLTKRLALGVETIYQRAPEGQELAATYLCKFTGAQQDWIATAQMQPIGLLQASYWQKLSGQVEVGADLQLIAAPLKRDAIATVGAKWDLRMASFKAQLDSTGKVSALLEQRFAPNFAFLLTGEIDHFKVGS
jgi:mitochondrial import receptor subunit TOM40